MQEICKLKYLVLNNVMDAYKFTIKTVKEAGSLLLKLRESKFEVMIKDGDPKNMVTSVDNAVNKFIIKKIKKSFPSYAIYSEEGQGVIDSSEYKWTIDPIDGTSNFVRGIPHFAVCLGLLQKNKPIVGAVYNPITKELFSFEKGKGSFLNGKPIKVSKLKDLSKSYVLFHAGRKDNVRLWGGTSYSNLLGSAKKTSNLACSSLDTCFVASGRVEANIYGTLSVLDISAAIGILEEAGGVILSEYNTKVKISENPQKIFMANNKKIAKDLITLLK